MSKLKTARTNRQTPASVAARSAGATQHGELHVFVRDLLLTAKIGLHQHERLASQRIRINLGHRRMRSMKTCSDSIAALVMPSITRPPNRALTSRRR